MKRLFPLLLCLLSLLSGCAGDTVPAEEKSSPLLTTQIVAQFPPAYDLSVRMEAFQGDQRTSYSHFSAVRTADGFYYAASTGEHYLFLRQDDEAYAFFLWDESAGKMVPNQGLLFSETVLEGFQDSLLHLGLLIHDTDGLAEGGTATVAGRSCRIFQGEGSAGDQFSCRQCYYIDEATGLTLFHSIQCRDQAGRTFSYLLTCETFATQGVELPEPALGL